MSRATVLVCSAALLTASCTRDGRTTPVLAGLDVQGLAVEGLRVSPAEIGFLLFDEESDPASVRLSMILPSAPGQEVPLTALDRSLDQLATSPKGIVHRVAWRFSDEPDLPDRGNLVAGVTVRAHVLGGTGGDVVVDLGNDAPVAAVATLPSEILAGAAPLRINVFDSTADRVDLRVEFRPDDDPGAPWRPVRPAGLEPTDPTPEFALTGLEATRVGREYEIAWDTDYDVPQLDGEVQVRVQARDDLSVGAWSGVQSVRVDNNASGSVEWDTSGAVPGGDRRQGIPLTLRALDREGDPVDVLFQWRRSTDPGYEPLGTSEREVLAAQLLDPAFVQEKRICRPFPVAASGRVVPVDATHVRLPELADAASWIGAHGVVGLRLETLRGHEVPQPLAARWPSSPLVAPVAALPLGAGVTGLVLDQMSPEGWTLREVVLATGEIVRELAAATLGRPLALAEGAAGTALMTVEAMGGWQLLRVDLASGAVTSLVLPGAGGATRPNDAPRGLLSLGGNAALITAEDGLWRLDWGAGASRVSRVVGGLATPWGLARDPRDTRRVWLAERDGAGRAGVGRVVVVDLGTLAVMEVRAGAAASGQPAFPRPTGLAFDRRKQRLLVLCEEGGRLGLELRALDLLDAARTATPIARFAVAGDAVAVGPEGVLLVTHAQAADVSVGGGVEQSRALVGLDGCIVEVDRAFDPPLRPAQPWRMRTSPDLLATVPAGPQGITSSFVWDSRDVPGGGDVFVQAIPFDTAAGPAVETAEPVRVTGLWPASLGLASTLGVSLAGRRAVAAGDLDADGVPDLVLVGRDDLLLAYQVSAVGFPPHSALLGGAGVTDGVASAAVADLDDDGRPDVIAANERSSTITVFYQEDVRAFSAPQVLGGPGVTEGAYAVVPADLDGDGDLDLVSANRASSNLTVFFRLGPGAFDPQPLVLGAPTVTAEPTALAVADLDGDGDMDLVSANQMSRDLTVFFQTAPGVFGPTPLVLAEPGTLTPPVDVEAADLDGDGDLDLVIANLVGHHFAVFVQTEPGVFDPEPLILGGPGVTAGPADVAAADLDGDGDVDLACAYAADVPSTFLQIAPGRFERGPGFGPDAVDTVLLHDLDHDGAVDAVVSGLAGSSVFSSASWAWQRAPIPSAPSVLAPTAFATGDLDRDGDLDLVTASDGALNLYFQAAPRVFDGAVVLGRPAGFDLTAVAIADVNDDGALDIVSAGRGGITLWLQEASRSFQPQTLRQISVFDCLRSIVAADLDGDGDVDLATADECGDTVVLRWQDEQGQFVAPQVLGGSATSPSVQSLVAADIDADGDVDLVAAAPGSGSALGRLLVFWQRAPGVFDPVPLTVGLAQSRPVAVAAHDLDGDGDLDLVGAYQSERELRVFWQTVPGAFDPVPQIVTGPGVGQPVSVVGADLDADGDADLLGTYAGGAIRAFLQDSGGRFRVVPPVIAPRNVDVPLLAEDVDGDGEIDVVATDRAQTILLVRGS
ncbi:MAG: VCBS repeat-containing protein [Planctomycetota bacterium]